MQLYDSLQTQHPALSLEKRQAFMLWCLSEAESLECKSDALQAILEQGLPEDVQACYELLSQLELRDLVGYTLINEFGARYTTLNPIIERIVSTLAAKA